MGVWGSGGSAFEGYDYVQNAQPVNPGEGQTWYDIDGNAAYVFDGNAWVQMTVTDHGQLSGVGANDHHTKPTATGPSNTPTTGRTTSGINISGSGFVGVYATEVRMTSHTFARDFTIHLGDGGSVSGTAPNNGSTWVSFNGPKWVVSFSSQNGEAHLEGLNLVDIESHSHSI